MKNLDIIWEEIEKFAKDRDWEKYHDPKNLSMAIVGEAGELIEIFQWLTPFESNNLTNSQIKETEEEIADIAIYLIRLSQVMGIDLLDAINKKISINKKKYPIEKAKGNATKYNKR